MIIDSSSLTYDVSGMDVRPQTTVYGVSLCDSSLRVFLFEHENRREQANHGVLLSYLTQMSHILNKCYLSLAQIPRVFSSHEKR